MIMTAVTTIREYTAGKCTTLTAVRRRCAINNTTYRGHCTSIIAEHARYIYHYRPWGCGEGGTGVARPRRRVLAMLIVTEQSCLSCVYREVQRVLGVMSQCWDRGRQRSTVVVSRSRRFSEIRTPQHLSTTSHFTSAIAQCVARRDRSDLPKTNRPLGLYS